MKQNSEKTRVRFLQALAIGACYVWLIVRPEDASLAAAGALSLCAKVIVPSLFPFFVCANLFCALHLTQPLERALSGVMQPVFGVPGSGAAALVVGLTGGYPSGAQTIAALYAAGSIDKKSAGRLLLFCNNCGPAFILGVVGTGIFGSGRAGLMLYFAHLAASLLIGLLFRFYRPEEGPRRWRQAGPQFQATSFPAAFTRSVTGALQSTLNICAFILFFTVAIRIFTFSGLMSTSSALLSTLLSPFGLSQQWAQKLLTGLLEMSSGVSSLTEGALTGRLSMAAFMLGWAGVSVHCQVMAFLGDSGLSLRTYVAGKLLHGALSAALIGGLLWLFPQEISVASYLAEQTEAIAALDFHRALTISAAWAWGMWLVFFALALYVLKKSSGKRGRSVL